MDIHNIAQLTGHKGGIYALEQATESQCFYSADGAGWVVKWDITEPDIAHLIAKVPSNIFALCLIKKQNLLAVGSLQGIVYFIDLQKNEILLPPIQLPAAIYTIRQWQNYLLIGTGSGNLSILNLQNRKVERTIAIAPKSIRQISIHPFLPKATIGSSDCKIYYLDLTEMKVNSEWTYHKNSVFCLQFLNEGKQLIAGSRDAHLSVWEESLQGDFYTLQHAIPAHLFTINDLKISPNQKYIATASRDKSIKIWDSSTWKLLKVIDRMKPELDAHHHSVNTLLWTSFQNYLISGSDDKTIRIWRIHDVS